ncbi:folate-binding protein [uncultured Parasutterella sp.]|uniref:CAF17-like 4Fe-4S cluster assembly/insertion protein YgfZ n=1 Tax=uncultured Parasutterella sp. TaxID=1263098 RepID=UPI0025B5F7F4|nr:folate-binding protein [uncultured Parasutterella sp.]
MSTFELSSWTFSQEEQFSFVTITGEDAETFLQGMLTQDVKKLPENRAAWAAACNHQGRVAASSLIFRIPNGFGMLLPLSIAQAEVDRLNKFVLRSKVELSLRPDAITYFCSPDAKAVDIPCPALPRNPMDVYVGQSVITVRLPSNDAQGMHGKFIAIGQIPDNMMGSYNAKNRLARSLMEEGIALIEKPESLEWLPQALNLDLIGAIAANKGCYTGQEIVSKTQNLGKVKRRMFLGICKEVENPDAGKEIFVENEPMGRIIQSDGEHFLFVLNYEYMDSELFLESKPVKILPLPYEVTVPSSVLA